MNKIFQLLKNYKFTILLLGIIFFLSLSEVQNINKPNFFKFEGSDKVAHFLMYAFLTFIYLLERTKFFKMKIKNARWYHTLWIVFIGAFIEILQPELANREKDFWDFAANTLGIALTYMLFCLMRKYYNFNKISSS
ncbi:MAG: VanZ family protein [Bacteroidota bacterium]